MHSSVYIQNKHIVLIINKMYIAMEWNDVGTYKYKHVVLNLTYNSLTLFGALGCEPYSWVSVFVTL